jgi:mannose/fructose/N-acetylgalactosamine-specific phosphotransferase system component IID
VVPVFEVLFWLIKLPFVLLGVVLSVVFALLGAVLSVFGAIFGVFWNVLIFGLVVLAVLWLLVKLFGHTKAVAPGC